MPGTRVNGVRLHHAEEGDGVPILCIHGTGSSSELWTGAMRALAAHGRAIVYDRRGFGRSERPVPAEGGVGLHADDAAALLDALGAVPAVVVGRSQGAEIAVDLALRHPRHVRALALLEGGGLGLSPALRDWLAEVDRAVFAAAETDPSTAGDALLRAVLGDDGWEALPAPVRRVFAANGPAIVAEERAGPLEVTAADLGTIRVPVLLVGAADSPAPMHDAMDRIAAAMPAARRLTVDGDHLIDPAHPGVLAFVAEITGDRRSGDRP